MQQYEEITEELFKEARDEIDQLFSQEIAAATPDRRKVYAYIRQNAYRHLTAAQIREATGFKGLIKDVVGELRGYQRSLHTLPTQAVHEVSYEALTERPAEVVAGIARFLKLEPTAPLDGIEARPRRGKLHPRVEAQASAFTKRLSAAGLTSSEVSN